MEALMAIVISLVMMSGAVATYSLADRQADQEMVRMGLVDLRMNLIDAFSTRSDYTGLDLAAARDLGVVPTVFKGNSGPDGSTLALATGPDSSFEIELDDFNTDEVAEQWCLLLLPDPNGEWVMTAADGAFASYTDISTVQGVCDGVSTLTFRGR